MLRYRSLPLHHLLLSAGLLGPMLAASGCSKSTLTGQDGAVIGRNRDGGADDATPGTGGCTPSGPLQTLASTGDFYTNPRFSPDGRHVAVIAFAGFAIDDVLLLDRCGAVQQRLGVAAKARGVATWAPIFSPDGGAVYVAETTGISRVSVGDGTVQPIVSADQAGANGFDVSRDGRQLVYSDGFKLYVQPLGTATATPATFTVPASFPRFSPDGTRVAFFSNQAVEVLTLSTGTMVQVASDGAAFGSAAWFGDNQTLAYADGAGNIRLVAASGGGGGSGGGTSRVVGMATGTRDLDVSQDDSAIVYGVNGATAVYALTGFAAPPPASVDGGAPDTGASCDAGPATVALLSASAQGAQGTAGAFSPAVSQDGRFVAFESAASNLVPGDTNGKSDIFVVDRAQHQIARVSLGLGGAEQNGDAHQPEISGDGRFVAFLSNGTNLVQGATLAVSQVYLYDRQAGTTELISRTPAGKPGATGAYAPAIDRTGRYVAFESDDDDLADPRMPSWVYGIYIRDRMQGTTTRISVDGTGATGNFPSTRAAISADGRYVAFQSEATNLVAGDGNGAIDVFVRDRMQGTLVRASVGGSGAGTEGNGPSNTPALSADGRYVAFTSAATNLVTGDTNGHADVFVRDLQSGSTVLASAPGPGGQASADSVGPAISGDGRFVVFLSSAPLLASTGSNGVAQVYRRDLVQGVLTMISVSGGGAAGAGASSAAAVSGDGTAVVFSSAAPNLVGTDGNGNTPDVFALAPGFCR